ncbi:ATP-binding cassette domain-containing protein [Actinosynnema sp. NPDC023587]|uniref:ABC transporter ATP-binding protein n=1 Tax=Actinosynnema sp. NPDC023587 TaxID=3154695 RepID=UPI0033CC7A31
MGNSVRVEGVGHRYGGVVALEDLSVDFPIGVTAVLGPNGAGKSTLLGLLSTGLRIQSGTVVAWGVDSVRDRTAYRCALGFLPQTFTLPGNLTVAELLTLAAWQRLVPRRERASAVAEALAAVDLTGRKDTKVAKLSGGMHRRVGIAQAIVNRPDVVLLDEPTAGLDPRQRRGLRDLVRAVADQRTVVLSTHLTEDVAAMADRVAVLDEGRIRFTGTVDEFTGGTGAGAAHIDEAYDSLVGDER